jgi:hypothetical protein
MFLALLVHVKFCIEQLVCVFGVIRLGAYFEQLLLLRTNQPHKHVR